MWSKKEADTSIRGLPFYVKRETFTQADRRQKAACVVSLLLVLTMLCVIFRFSAANATQSSHLSEGVCIRIVRESSCIFPEQFPKEKAVKIAQMIEFPVRKCAHFTEYAVLSMTVNLYLWVCCWLESQKRSKKEKMQIPLEICLRAELFCTFYACTDELHQYFVPGRSCRFFDVCVDSTGAFCGGLFCGAILLWRSSRRKRQEISKKSKS